MTIPPWRQKYYRNKSWVESSKKLHTLFDDGDIISVKKFLDDKNQLSGINPNYTDDNGDSYLHKAVRTFQWDIVQRISKLDVRKDIENKLGLMAYDYAYDKNEVLNFKKSVSNSTYPPYQRPSKNIAVLKEDLISKMQGYYRYNFSGAVYPGRRLTDNLDIFLECEDGRCDIPNRWPELDKGDSRALTLHQRLAMANYLSAARARSFNNMDPDNTSNCYVNAAITFVIAKTANEGAKVKMKPVIIPVNVPGQMVHHRNIGYAHAERVFIDYLNTHNAISQITEQLVKKINYAGQVNCYAIVFDIHSTYSVCKNCELEFYKLQGDRGKKTVLRKFEKSLLKNNFVLPKVKEHSDILTPETTCLYTATRLSHRRPFPHFHNPKDSMGYEYPSYDEASDVERNIARTRGAVIFHSLMGDPADLYQFNHKQPGKYMPSISPVMTAFVMHSRWANARRKMKMTCTPTPESQVISVDDGTISKLNKHRISPIWTYIQEGDFSKAAELIQEHLGQPIFMNRWLSKKSNAKIENIYSIIVKSGNVPILQYTDNIIKEYNPNLRDRFLTNDLLGSARTIEIFSALIDLGLEDPDGFFARKLFAHLRDDDKNRMIEHYTTRNWSLCFLTDGISSHLTP